MAILCLARHELLEQRPGWGAGLPRSATITLEPLGAGAGDLDRARGGDEVDRPETRDLTLDGNRAVKVVGQGLAQPLGPAQRRDQAIRFREAAAHLKTEHSAKTGHLRTGQRILGMRFQTGVKHGFDLWVRAEKFRQGQRVTVMLFHA